MTKTMKKKIHRQLIKMQNKFGKAVGKSAWIQWKIDNGYVS